MERIERAVRAAVRVASWHGVRASEPVVLRDRANLLVHLAPAPVVARIPSMTAAVRANPEEWLAREVAVAGFAAARGAPVVPPTADLPPGPHHCDGSWMTFSRFERVVERPAPDGETMGALLRELHEALADYPGTLPRLTPLTEIPAMIEALEPVLAPDDVEALHAAYERSVVPLLGASAGAPALHGDSNVHNLVATDGGFLWGDFEDTGAGPPAWDLACAVGTERTDPDALRLGYGAPVDPDELDSQLAAREVQGLVWLLLVGTRFPDRVDEGRRRLAALRR